MTRPALAILAWLLSAAALSVADEPAEDVWAIRCASFSGPNRVRQADNCAEHLRHVDGLDTKLVQIFHEREESIVYYGRYQRRIDDKTNRSRFKPDPAKELALIRSLSMETGDGGRRQLIWPFRFATMETLPVPSSVPDAWNLANAPGYYSLQVAVFYDTQEMHKRRAAAEAYCRLLRDGGEQAYVYHGPENSIVCVGAYPKLAIRRLQQRDPLTGRVRVVQRIVDKDMLAAQKRHPYHLENGAKMYEVSRDPKTGKKVRDPHITFPVVIPKRDPFAGLNGR